MRIKRHKESLRARTKPVKVTIAPDGACTVDALNFTGRSCQAATGEITAALGGQIDHQHVKPEARIRERGTQGETNKLPSFDRSLA